MKKVLILGAKGNLGHQLISIFQGDHEVIGWDREDIDITDKDLIMKKINDIKPDILINATGYNAVDKCEDDEREYENAKKLNGYAVGYLAQASIKCGALFINYSTDYVFSGNYRKGYKETDAPDPINNYGRSKLIGEQEIIKLSGKGLKWYLIRPSKLFGPKGSGELVKPSFFDIMLKLGNEKEELKVVDEEFSCFTYTIDLARATRKLADENKGYGIYHFVNEGPCTWYRAAKELFKLTGNKKVRIIPVKSDEFPRPAKRPKYSRLLNTKLEPMRDYREALKEYFNK